MAEIITVAALNKYVKSILDSDSVLPGLGIRGEITNFTNHYKSGHWYFTLRDEQASVKAVMFRRDAQQVGFVPQEGMRVVIRGRVSLYEANGAFQIYVSDMFPDGVGAAQLAFDQLKEKLEREGLFASEHKKSIPKIPRVVGVVTSATGAALQDIRNVLSRRWPFVKILLAPVNVQGDTAANEICRGIKMLDSDGQADVIVVARGGGSREDLWVFNDERIARAAYACNTPLISAVGHEIDFSILDFVADLRAPTPSAAAEVAVPDCRDAIQNATDIFMNIHENMQKKLEICYNILNNTQERYDALTPAYVCTKKNDKLEFVREQIVQAKKQLVEREQNKISRAAALAHTLSPYAVLGRGYAAVRDEDGNFTTVEQLKKSQKILLCGKNTVAACTVDDVSLTKGEKNEKAKEL